MWHIGSPSSGPGTNNIGFRTHTGTNCASTQGYPYSQDGRLVCTNYGGASFLNIPAANLFPRLRFWHWFNLDNALGYVEVSTDGTNWTQLSPTYEKNYNGTWINSGGVWSRPSLDLSAYAGQNIQIAFHFTSGCCVGNGLGWYVDDVEVDTGLPILNFPENFEFDPKMTDWSVDYGTWEIGSPASGPPRPLPFGTNCAGTVLGGNYANAADTRLLSPLILVPPSGSPRLNFWQWYSFNNALGYLEIHNGSTNGATITNTVVKTNAVAVGLNTNIYELFGAAISAYSTPLYWNQTIGGWTNASKALGVVNDLNYGYYFDAGSAPLQSVGVPYADYRASVLPNPRSFAATNFLSLQGATWNAASGGTDNPIGYFGTNYAFTYTTNITVSTNTSSGWVQLSPTYLNLVSGTWTNVSFDLSTYAGQVVQIAFHFTSGDCCGTSSGWYVDDLNLLTAPLLMPPTNASVSFGQSAVFALSATNSFEPDSTFSFGLAAASTNVVVVTNGTIVWTNTVAPPGTYVVYVKVSDSNAISATNNFPVTVLPLSSQLVLTNASAKLTTNGGSFKFSVLTPWTNSTWLLLATTNLNDAPTNWLPIYTNQTGSGGAATFTDLLSTNFLRRYYRAVFP